MPDATALLCLLQGGPGAALVAAMPDGAMVSAVNLAEVVTKLVERGSTPEDIEAILAGLDMPVILFDARQAAETGLLRASARHLGLSLGDRACLAFAGREAAAALTADRVWTAVPDVRGEPVLP